METILGIITLAAVVLAAWQWRRRGEISGELLIATREARANEHALLASRNIVDELTRENGRLKAEIVQHQQAEAAREKAMLAKPDAPAPKKIVKPARGKPAPKAAKAK